MDLPIKGLAAFPKLQFDRREILMPVVPLNVESRCMFKIFNVGYENMTLKEGQAYADEVTKLKLDIVFPENRNISKAKDKLKVEVVFKSPKPLSFTTKLQFFDEQNKLYEIPISGTADNSIFTNFQYLQRNKGDFTYELDSNQSGPVKLVDEEH